MGALSCLLLACAPGLFWLWVFYKRDRWEPEPLLKVLKLFALGGCIAVPCYFVQGALPFVHPLFDIFVRVALVEELFKFAPVWLVAYYHKEFNERMDGIVYAVACALGFATAENALYVYLLGPKLLVLRAFTSTLAHVAFSGLVGYAMGSAKFGKRNLVPLALAVVVTLHGLYDYLLSHSRLGNASGLALVPMSLLMLWWAVERACKKSPFRETPTATRSEPDPDRYGVDRYGVR